MSADSPTAVSWHLAAASPADASGSIVWPELCRISKTTASVVAEAAGVGMFKGDGGRPQRDAGGSAWCPAHGAAGDLARPRQASPAGGRSGREAGGRAAPGPPRALRLGVRPPAAGTMTGPVTACRCAQPAAPGWRRMGRRCRAPDLAAKPACRWNLQRPVPVTLPARARPARKPTAAIAGPGREQRTTLHRAEVPIRPSRPPEKARQASLPAAQPGPPVVLDLARHEADGERWAGSCRRCPQPVGRRRRRGRRPEEGRGLAAEGAVHRHDAGEPIFGQPVSYPSGGQADPAAAFRQLPGSGKGTSPPSPARPGQPGSPSFLRCRCVQPGAPLPAARVLRCAAPFQARRRRPAAGRSPSAAKGAARHQE